MTKRPKPKLTPWFDARRHKPARPGWYDYRFGLRRDILRAYWHGRLWTTGLYDIPVFPGDRWRGLAAPSAEG